MINPDHAKRVLEHLRETPVMILAKRYSLSDNPSPQAIWWAEDAIAAISDGGYAIEPIEDYE